MWVFSRANTMDTIYNQSYLEYTQISQYRYVYSFCFMNKLVTQGNMISSNCGTLCRNSWSTFVTTLEPKGAPMETWKMELLRAKRTAQLLAKPSVCELAAQWAALFNEVWGNFVLLILPFGCGSMSRAINALQFSNRKDKIYVAYRKISCFKEHGSWKAPSFGELIGFYVPLVLGIAWQLGFWVWPVVPRQRNEAPMVKRN